MDNTKRLILIAFSFLIGYSAFAQEFLSVGPMIHVNIGNGKVKPSYGLEVAYWNFSAFPYSIDFGAEFEKAKFRVYSEGQTGIGVAGVSAGPFLEFKRASPIQAGVQGSFWFNYFLGLDCRFRLVKGKDYIAPGIYAKLPFALGAENKGESSNGSSDWDWDD